MSYVQVLNQFPLRVFLRPVLLNYQKEMLISYSLLIYTNYIKEKDIQSLENVKSYHLKVIFDPSSKKLIYDRKLEEGNGPTIYGLEVCKAMDLDEDFLKLANKIRQEILEVDEKILSDHKSQYNSDLYVDLCKVCNEKATETHHIKEQHEADENKMIGNIPKDNLSNLVPLCNECHLKVHHNNLLIKDI